MSAKSAAHPSPRTHSVFSRKTILVTVIAVALIFLITIIYYPLAFGPEETREQPQTVVR